MIYAAIFATIGWHTFCDAMPNGEKILALIGLAMYMTGMICGELVENRLKKRIKNLESKIIKEE